MICSFILHRWYVAKFFVGPSIVVPIYPILGRVFHCIDARPWSLFANQFSLEKTIDYLDQRVVVRITNTAHRVFDANVNQTICVYYR